VLFHPMEKNEPQLILPIVLSVRLVVLVPVSTCSPLFYISIFHVQVLYFIHVVCGYLLWGNWSLGGYSPWSDILAMDHPTTGIHVLFRRT
jgi:hypothetical protein